MECMQCIRTRRSVRKFKPDAVSEDALRGIIEAAACAPSWKNAQPTRYIAITNEAMKKELAEKATSGFAPNGTIITGAPVVLLVTTVSPRSGFERDGSFSTDKGTHWESFDAGIAAQTLCLAAHDAGLGTVILGIFDEAIVKEIARVPDGQKVSALIALGYAAETPAMPRRKTVDELLTTYT